MNGPLSTAADDLVDRIVGLAEGSVLHALRHQRDKVAAATQGSYEALFHPGLPGLPLVERLLVALHASLLTSAPVLAAHYRERLAAAEADPALVKRVEGLGAPAAAATAGDRLQAMLSFTRMLIERPVAADRAALQSLTAAGMPTPAVVALAQLIAFMSYQVRLVASLHAMKQAHREGRADAPPAASPAPPSPATDVGDSIIRSHGFTNESLDWEAWLDVVKLEDATPEQIQVLEESHPKAKVSDYYRLLVHQPEILRQRSSAFNAIMYAPRGLSRAERELGATVTSRINGCVYCTAVHAQRFEQMARRNDVIRQVFDAPRLAGTSKREQAIVQFSIALTQRPGAIGAADIHALEAVGLEPLEILDLAHSVAIFAWANRLMLNLGGPVAATAT
ncbi:MAG: peroxidase-related enzyme [Lautropia sp.]|nr:peroxidase-related enzyme [Lautropia sp.]